MASAARPAIAPKTPSAIDSGLTARSTFVSVMAVTVKLASLPLGSRWRSFSSSAAMEVPCASCMAYQVPWTLFPRMSARVRAGVNTTSVGRRSASSSITWLLKTTSPVSFMFNLRCGATLGVPKPGRPNWVAV